MNTRKGNKKMEKGIKECRINELRAIDENEERMVVEGYAIVFNSPTDLGDYVEMISPGALDRV